MRLEKNMLFLGKEMRKDSLLFIKLRKLKRSERGKKRPKMKFQETKENIMAEKARV